MACTWALKVCITVYDSRDEAFLVSTLSNVRLQLQQGFKYFSQNSDADTVSKEQVRHFVKRISAFLNISEFLSREILVHFLATHDVPEDRINEVILSECASHFLEDIRCYYWKERLSLLRLFKVCVCQWHRSWSLISDVLFAMTSYDNRVDLIIAALSEYLNEHQNTLSLVESWHQSPSIVSSHGISVPDTSDQLSAIVSQKLKELIELLELILLGVHGMVLLGTLENPSFLFTKILETFWSVSYGSSLRNLKAHHLLVEQLCFTQTLILIRAANLDSLVLYSTKSLNLLTTYPGLENVNLIPSCKSESIVEDLPISKNVQVADGNTTHFLYDSSLLNRLLASLSSLGEHKVHGPLLLFGAVCATAFTRSGSHSLTSSNHSPDSTHELPGVLKSRYSNNASMISDRCAQLAIQNLDVFHFLIGKLDQANCQPPQVSSVDSTASLAYVGFNPSLVSISAHSAIFDLVTLLARDVTLWSLDSSRPPDSHLFHSLHYPNRDAFLVLFSRTLRVVVTNAHLACCSRPKGDSKTTSDVTDVLMDSGPRIGYRVFGLIESFMESFPYDLSVLRIYTSLLSPSNDTKNVSGSDDLLNNVKDLINHVPYLAEPLTEILSRQLSPQRSLLCPQLTLGAGKKYNNQVVLKKSRTVMAEHSKVISGQTNLPDKINIFSGVYLPSGTYGYVDQELGLVVWRVEYSLWHIIGNEIHLTELALNKLHKSITSSPQTYEAYLLPNGTSHCSEAFHIQAEYYAQFYIRLTRLLEIVNFISACLKCDFYINPCLVSLEYIWVIIMHYLNLVSSSRVDHIVQYLINTSSLIKTHQKVYESKICPDESNVNCNPVEELITSCLLPSLLSLIGCSLLNLPTITSNQLIVDNVNLLTSVLKSSTNLMPRMFINQSGKNQPLTFALSSCYLINNILGYKSSEPVTVYRPHIISPFYIRPADYGLLISYINFMSGLFFFVRWAYANSKFINENIQHGYMPLYVECSELIHGCLVFIIQCLMTTCLQVDYCLGSTNRSPSDNFLQVDFDRLANLAEHCFMLLTDVLTTRVSDQDIQILQMTLKQLKQESSSSSSNIFPKFFFEEETHWPITYQCIALHLLFNDIRSLSSLVAFSSIHLGILLRQTETIENSFPMSICPNGIDASEKTVSMCSSSPTIRAVWLALTLVHHLLGLENKLTIEPGNPNADTPLLTCIQSHYDRLTGDHYITTLFSYLRYPYSVGISRLVVALLKWIAQYSSVDLTIYLGSQLNQIRASCLKRLVSTTEDQLTRIGLYDLLSEVVLNSEKSGFVGSRLPGGLLRLFLANGSVTGGDRKLNRLMSSVEENSESDCLDCAIVTLNELQAKFTQTQLNNDKLSVVLYWSVTKFISSIYLLNMQPCIVSLKQRSTFWEILTNPLFTLLKLRESEKEALSDIENELCGNVISTLALEMYSRTNYATDESFKSFMVVMDSMVKNNLYALWFKLTRICLNKMTSHSESNDTSMERIHSRLTSLHNVTCRWKCLLLLNYNDDVSFFSDKKESNNSVNESDDFIPIAKSILDDLIECFKPLKDLPPVQPTLDVGNQLATTLTTTLSYLHKAYDMPNRNQSIERLSYNDLFNYLTKLNDLLSTFRLSVDVQVQHMHADLLASVCLLFKWYESVKLNKPEPTSEMELLKSSLFNNAVCCLSLLTRNSNRNTIEESAIKQSINVIIILWDHCGRSTLFSRLTETGVLNNILILLTECTKVKDGATLCHCLTSLLVKLVMNSSQLEYEGITITDLDESDDFLLIQQKNTIAHVIISYHEYISTAFYWPQMDTLSRWLQDSETYSNQRISLFNGDRELQSFNYNMHYDWNAVFILQIQLLCLLHDSLGGMKHPLVCSLIQNFCANNASQLEYMVTYWCLPLYTTPINDQSFVSPLPLTSVLIQQGILLTCRIRLAEVILKLYWRILVASECISTSGLPIIAPTILYSSCPRTENDRNRHRSLPSYGPSVQSELFYAIFNMIQRQIHCCSILFQRHGYKSLKGVPVSLSQVTTGVSAINSQLTPVLPRTPMANKITEVSSPHVISSISVELTDSESSELELLCLIRHLVISLSVLIVQLPMLGNTSLMTSDELRHSTVPIQLTFNSPNFGDNSVVLTFGVLIALANSLASLSSKLTYLWKSSQFSENETVQRKQELCSLVHRAYEMVLSIIFSQSALLLTSPSTRLVDKQLLTRELTAELKACHSFGISVRRTSSVSHSTAAILSRSPSNRSSSSRLLWGSASPQTPVSVPSTALKSVPLPGSSFSTIDHSNLGFDKAANRFMEFLRLTL